MCFTCLFYTFKLNIRFGYKTTKSFLSSQKHSSSTCHNNIVCACVSRVTAERSLNKTKLRGWGWPQSALQKHRHNRMDIRTGDGNRHSRKGIHTGDGNTDNCKEIHTGDGNTDIIAWTFALGTETDTVVRAFTLGTQGQGYSDWGRKHRHNRKGIHTGDASEKKRHRRRCAHA